MSEYKRKGDQSKCPVCGTGIDSHAYRCPKCRVYFCFKCRVQIRRSDQQSECANQTCDYYGKLLCDNCSPELEFTHERMYTFKDPAYAGDIFWTTVINAFTVLLFALTFTSLDLNGAVVVAAGVGAAVAAGGVALTKHEGGHLFTEKKERTETDTTYHDCCIKCKQPVKRRV